MTCRASKLNRPKRNNSIKTEQQRNPSPGGGTKDPSPRAAFRPATALTKSKSKGISPRGCPFKTAQAPGTCAPSYACSPRDG